MLCCRRLINPFWKGAAKRFAGVFKTETAGAPFPPSPMDLKPTLDVTNLRSTAKLQSERRKTMESAIQRTYTDVDRKQVTAILRKLRTQQTKRLGFREEDPDPYDPDYLFYCLTGTRELYS